MGTTTIQPRRIFRVTVRFTEGKGISRQIRCPVGPRRKNSLAKLERRLSDMTVGGVVTSSRITAPDRPKHKVACLRGRRTPGHKCECFIHWTDIERLTEAV